MWNWNYNANVAPPPPPTQQWEVEYDGGWQHHDQNWNYGGGHGGFNHYQNEMDIQYEPVNANWGGHNTWGNNNRNNEWTVPWKGWYKQDGSRHDMYFQDFQCD